MATDPLEKAKLIADGMENRRALDVMILDVGDLMTITEYFVICHGRSQTHVDAISQGLQGYLGERGIKPDHREGGRGARWVILDCGSAVAHIFAEDARDYYDLERLWEDAPVVDHLTDGDATDLASEGETA